MALFATAFVVRLAVGLLFPGPAHPDSYSHVHVGEQLASGYGLMANYIWNLVEVGATLPADPTLPIPHQYLTGHQGIVTPNDPLPVIEDVMRAYDVRWLVLEREAIVPALVPVLAGEMHPTWLSPVAVVPRSGGPAIASVGPAVSVMHGAAGALYAVCVSPADTRCAR